MWGAGKSRFPERPGNVFWDLVSGRRPREVLDATMQVVARVTALAFHEGLAQAAGFLTSPCTADVICGPACGEGQRSTRSEARWHGGRAAACETCPATRSTPAGHR